MSPAAMTDHEHTIAERREVTAPCPPGRPAHTKFWVLRCACGFVDVFPRSNWWLTTPAYRDAFEQAIEESGGQLAAGLDRQMIPRLRAEVAAGSGHECSEWLDVNGQCQLCDRAVR